jgi:DNA mismatch repair protein MutL
MSSIIKLPPRLIDQIAAGEVVERPASVVKELCENAIDAGARRISVTINDGGQSLIRIEDDGCGIAADELALALESHATSKLRTVDDLERITTLGFRGEALASIAAVAHVELASRTVAQEAGATITVAGGEQGPIRPCGRPPGTTVTVRDLFFNVPARRKFLGAPRGEVAKIRELLCRFALVHGDCAWELLSEERSLLAVPANLPLRERASRLFEPALADRLIEVAVDTPEASGHLLLAPTAVQRATRRQQLLFINGRCVADRQLAAALAEAYARYLAPRRFPVWFAFLLLDPTTVDVNVHPRKEEVRIEGARRLYGVIHHAAAAALADNLQPPALLHDPAIEPRSVPSLRAANSLPAMVDHAMAASAQPAWIAEDTPAPRIAPAPPLPVLTASLHDAAATATRLDQGRLAFDRVVEPDSTQRQRRAIQLHQAYLVEETADGIAIIDQHALHEKILYNQLRRAYESGPIARQSLLIPRPLELPAEAHTTLLTARDALLRVGIEIEPFGPSTVLIQALPALLARTDPCLLVETLAETLERGRQLPGAAALAHDLLAQMACKAAIKAGDPLDADGVTRLLQARDQSGDSYSCPHGRPTTLIVTHADLERRFLRR